MNADPKSTSATKATGTRLVARRMLKQFRLEGLLGEGGMGLVYRAYDTRLRRPVAVKVLSAELTADSQRPQRFLQEARAAARIKHPAVAQIFDADEEGGTTFIVMELVEGKTVQQLIKEQELDLLGVMDIGIQVAEGLGKAHELGIVHRDIKPANVMRTVDGHVKILDFGLAKVLEAGDSSGPGSSQALSTSQKNLTRTGLVMGTPAYMSPEQVRGLPVDLRADLFSLGVMLFEMATGQSPFGRGNFMDALHAAAFDEAVPMKAIRPEVPEGLQRVVSRCLRKRPEERYPNAHLLAEELRSIRRHTEAGLPHKTQWGQRLRELYEEFLHQSRLRVAAYGLGLVIGSVWLYRSVAKVEPGFLVFLVVAGLYLYRQVRNRPQRIREKFVKRASRIPEVRIIASREREISVVIDHPVAQLYGRLHGYLRSCNQRLYWGQPMTLTILHELSSEETRQILSSPGVEYVRDEPAQKE